MILQSIQAKRTAWHFSLDPPCRAARRAGSTSRPTGASLPGRMLHCRRRWRNVPCFWGQCAVKMWRVTGIRWSGWFSAGARWRRRRVIEINARLTTSYVGLRVLAETNLAEAMLRVVEVARFLLSVARWVGCLSSGWAGRIAVAR